MQIDRITPAVFDGDIPRWAFDVKLSLDKAEIDAIAAYGDEWQKSRTQVIAELLAGRLTLAQTVITRTEVRLRGLTTEEARARGLLAPRNRDG